MEIESFEHRFFQAAKSTLDSPFIGGYASSGFICLAKKIFHWMDIPHGLLIPNGRTFEMFPGWGN